MERFKHFLLTMLFTLTSITVSAFDFEDDGIYYNTISVQDLTCEVTNKNGSNNSYSGDIAIPSTVTYSGKTSSVTSIEGEAFYNCSSLTSFSGKFASEDHRCLMFDGELNSFAPAGLTSYVIPNSVTSIESSAFYNTTVIDYICDNENYVSYFKDTVKRQTLGENVNNIDNSFGTKLETLTIKNSTPPTFSIPIPFTDKQYKNLNVFVPEDAIEQYKSADVWKRFWNLNCYGSNNLPMGEKEVVLVRAQSGNIVVSGTERGEEIQLYTIDGRQLRNIPADDGETVISCHLNNGEIVVVRYGGK